jgi:biopolymer transport protein ExbD
MKVRDARINAAPKLMIIPLIDIIFSIVVFFIVNTMQMVYQKSLPVQLPVSEIARQDRDRNLVITVQKDGRVAVDDEFVANGALADKIRNLLAQRPNAGVIIRADKKTEHGNVVEIMGQIRNVGVTRLAVAVEEKSGSS